MPGELQAFVGTQGTTHFYLNDDITHVVDQVCQEFGMVLAYMAPEVFMKNNDCGHGRASDVWSIGCCIVEMASGRRPWPELDSNYQIMFKVIIRNCRVGSLSISLSSHVIIFANEANIKKNNS